MKKITIVACSLLAACGRLDTLLYEPTITASEWCTTMPCVELFSTGLILNQPFSTALVYLLSLLWLYVGWLFWRERGHYQVRKWWAVSLLLGGLAAISAGTSYQAFVYELKCVDREVCVWTNGWEIAYMTLQVASLNAMLIAVAYSSATGKLRQFLIRYAAVNYFAHLTVTLLGLYLVNKFMLSFEFLVLITSPTFVLYFLINGRRYISDRNPLDQTLLICWTILIFTNLVYFAYLFSGLTHVLWNEGLWFSENDALHVGVMLWLLYVAFAVRKQVVDLHS